MSAIGMRMGDRGRTVESSIASVLTKKKRNHVLSVVVEKVEEEEDSSSTANMVREPVAGQREGLADPLELDGEGTRIVELPTSVTPRARSREREGRLSLEAGRRDGAGPGERRYWA
jgi:hypothetical protein